MRGFDLANITFIKGKSNATRTTIAGYQAKDADLTLTIDRSELEDVMIGTATLSQYQTVPLRSSPSV